MANDASHTRRSHTRGVPLANLAGLCFVLGESASPLSVNELVTRSIRHGVIESESLQRGGRLPTRINHHIISLRELELVKSERSVGHVYYSLNVPGRHIYKEVKKNYCGEGQVELNTALRAAWRPILVESSYVRSTWLKYFMTCEEFTFEELISKSNSVTITRIPQGERECYEDRESIKDSGYRLFSQYWGDHIIYELDRREILQGLRRWTNEAYLTDDSVSSAEAAPFAHLSTPGSEDTFESESFIVNAWLDPTKDLPRFERVVNQLLDERKQGNRINIPDLIIGLSHDYGYAKENIKEMLTILFYERRDNYFFERGSRFLVDNAFKLTNKNRPEVYYLKLEGSWRTSLVRFGTQQRMASNE